MDHQPEQVQVQRPKFQMKNVAWSSVKGDDQADRLQNRADNIADSVLNGSRERADGDNLIVHHAELFDVEGPREFSTFTGCPCHWDGYTARHRSKHQRVRLRPG